MKKTIARWFQDAWYKEMYISTMIMPLSMFYMDFMRFRRFLYRKGIYYKSTKLPVPVIIVGNISVGGTGKTPLVIWLDNYLKQSGYKPGIISRGYGGQDEEQPLSVNSDSNPAQVGDEAVLISRHTASPMVICSDRVEAAQYLLKNNDCDVIISDDGLQHYALQRDIEIAVIDGQRRFGNGYCLPAGPLREPVERLMEVDLVIVNGEAQEDNEYSMIFAGDDAVNLKTGQTRPLSEFSKQPCHALAGIGNPNRFFTFLASKSIQFKQYAFPDHHPFSSADVSFKDEKPVLMTEKDAVKCSDFAQDKHWYVPIKAEPQAQFSLQLLKLLKDKTHG